MFLVSSPTLLNDCYFQVSESEVTRLVTSSLQPLVNQLPDFTKFSFCPRTLPDEDSGTETVESPLRLFSLFCFQ